MTKEKVKQFLEKILEKTPKLKEKGMGCYFQQDNKWEWCVGTPV